MGEYVAAKHVEHYFVQREETNPLGRRTGWQTVWSGDDDKAGAQAKAKAERAAGHKVRIVHHKGVSGGYTSL